MLKALSAERDERPIHARELQHELHALLGKLRPQRTPSDVRHVVDVFFGERPAIPELFAPCIPAPAPVVRVDDLLEDFSARNENRTLELEPLNDPVPVLSLGEYLWADTFKGREDITPENPYLGQNFVMRTKVGETITADHYEDLLHHWSSSKKRPDRISRDGYRFVDCNKFARLSGLEALLPGTEPLNNVSMVGRLEERNLIAVLASLAKIRATGKLVLMDTSARRVSRREIHISQGAPVYVASNAPAFQLPELLIRHRVIERDEMTGLLHDVLRTEDTLEEAICKQKGFDVVSFWPAVMRQRMMELFRWRVGRFAFDRGASVRPVLPFESSLFEVLLHGVEYGVSPDELWSWAQPYLNIELNRARTFDRLCRKLSLRKEVTRVATRLGKKGTLSQLLQKYPNDAHRLLALAYIFISSGELKRSLDKFGGVFCIASYRSWYRG